jgi:hypothetical protein
LARIGFSRNLGYRTDQAGLLVAATNVPLTFQRTLTKRPLVDQALVTGLSIAANHAVVALAQESVQAAALILNGSGEKGSADGDDTGHAWPVTRGGEQCHASCRRRARIRVGRRGEHALCTRVQEGRCALLMGFAADRRVRGLRTVRDPVDRSHQ